MSDYETIKAWVSLDEHFPPISRRVLLTDGISVVIGSFLSKNDTTIQWLFDRPESTYSPTAWMELPLPYHIK